ncbi:FAD-dependent oxidoreductase [Synoicihabitans lomoniglobus]|uniref:FAD-dependent oxidoreductase n=1 Tax=Synoicihabitans lomoniglobus TaxID=2909285 RepID=A0AAF0CLZ1_9BACT|nr:FAD-dependent oxidoreductase [Opitutaceae bacterium LMO-M01]WED63408.1 FAD-dependent oxidoreductase [Opitutaceae bacterium LMO-M01]
MSDSETNLTAEVVVIGGTPGGIAAAITAARLGRTVILTEYHPMVGAMMTNGLGKSDIETREAINGVFREFVDNVLAHYVQTYGPDHPNVALCQNGYYYEPSVAEKVLDAMLAAESNLRILRHHELDTVSVVDAKVRAAVVQDRTSGVRRRLAGEVFVDATYEGDLAAKAGVPYRLGREARREFNELHAGVVYIDYETGAFMPGTTGEGDRRLQAYTYRLCVTTNPANSLTVTAPPDYDREDYVGYLDDWRQGRMGPPREMREGMGYFAPTFNTVVRALSLAELPNEKYDVNINPRPLGFPFCEVNYNYPEADWPERERIMTRVRNLTLGLLYFLQNDEEVPEDQRRLARRFNLARDEFTSSAGFPRQLYVREARRIRGEYTLSENDVFVESVLGRTRVHADSIAAGEFPIDSFPVRKREPGQNVALEGYVLMLDKLTHPYQIPYGIIVPQKVDGLLVPVAASTTHVAFSTIRLEPTWMALGQAAGTAAHLALAVDGEVREVAMDRLQHQLLEQGQVLTFFKDLDREHPCFAGLQFCGCRGFFEDYQARADEPLDGATALRWLERWGHDTAPATDWKEAETLTSEQLADVWRDWDAAGGGGEGSPVTRAEFCQRIYVLMLERSAAGATEVGS